MTTKFSELGIKPTINHFAGDKVKISKVLNKKVTVVDFTVKPSNYKGECLYIQIEIDNEKRVVFTGSTVLIDTIKQVPREKFPFETVIVKENEYYEFT